MNPSGLCKCGCGGQTTIARSSNTKRGWVKGQPKNYLHGHAAKLPEVKEKIRASFWVRYNASEARKEREWKQARRARTQKQGPYKAGRTVMAKAALRKIEMELMAKAAIGKIESAMKRRGT